MRPWYQNKPTITISFLTILLFIQCIGSKTAFGVNAEQYYESGGAKEDKGDYDGAIADYDKAIKLKPDYAEAYCGRGTAKGEKGNYDEAMVDFDKAIQLKPDYARAYNNRGIAKHKKDDNDGAIADYDKVIKLEPDDALAYNNRGNAKEDKGDYNGAIADYDKVIQLKPNFALAYYNRGNAKKDKGDYDGAIADYDKVIQLKPNFAEAYNNRGNAKEDKGDYDGAIADYDKAIKLKPDYADAYYNRGRAKYYKDDYNGAIADCDKVIKLQPDDAEAYNSRGFTYEKTGEFEKAIKDYRKALEIEPNISITRKNLDNLFTVLNGNPDFVKRIQLMIYTIRYYHGDINGVLDKETRNALMAFQMDSKLKMTGEIDDKTHQLLTDSYQNTIGQTDSGFQLNFPREDGYVTTESSIPIDAVLKSSEEIDYISIKINDQTVKGTSDIEYNSQRTSANIDSKLPLSEGDNIITVTAFTKKGEVLKKKITVISNPKVKNIIGKKWAVVIGIEGYEDENIQKLDFSVNDAEEFTRILIEKCGFPGDQITLLTDKKIKEFNGVNRDRPTSEKIKRALFTTLRNKTSIGDTVIVYYSGHGALVPDPTSQSGMTAYLLPVDFQCDAPEVRGIRIEDIKRLAYLAPDRMFLIIDSCYSGADAEGVKSVSISGFRIKALPNITKGFAGKGRVLLTSCMDNQVSLESIKLKHSVFTYYLVDALKKERRLADIYRDVSSNVKKETNGAQEPKLDVGDQSGDILFY